METRLTKEEIDGVRSSANVRRSVAESSFEFFLELYFGHYVTAPFGSFHREIFAELENPERKFVGVMAFRGSGKSSIVSTAFAIWAMLWIQQRKYVAIFAQTQQQAKLYMKNLKEELETNSLLRQDLGPFEEDGSEWNGSSITLRNLKARLTVLSVDQSVRGLRHRNHRPDLIIADDVENLQSMRTREGRNSLYEWFTKELVPLGDQKRTRIVLLGNMLHGDSLLMRIKGEIENGSRRGAFLRYPLVSPDGTCIWPERYSPEDLEELKLSIGSETAWRTEYMLEEAGFDGQIINPEWVQRFDLQSLDGIRPTDGSVPWRLFTWVDLAISERDSADCTAFVSGWVWVKGKERIIYVVDAFAKRMDFPTAVEALVQYDAKKRAAYGAKHEIAVEDVGYQRAFVQQMSQRSDMKIEWVRPVGSKAERLTLMSDLIRTGKVVFARTPACDMLVEQMLGFGKERHDDLVDALGHMVTVALTKKRFIAVF